MSYFPQRCQHIKVNGTQCGCPALRRNKLCYFHKRHHEERVQINRDRAKRRSAIIDLPVLEDANSIQVALMQIMRHILAGQIDGKTAGLLLYALQTASVNLRETQFEPYKHSVVLDPKTVDETPLGGSIWDDSDFANHVDEADQSEAEAIRVEAAEKARRLAERQAEPEPWAQTDRDIEQSKRRVAAQVQPAPAIQNASPSATTTSTSAAPTATTSAVITPAGRAILPPAPTVHSAAKRPPVTTTMDDVRKQIREQVMEAFPAILAAQPDRRNGHSSG